jgi:hypothetical protein
MEFFEMGRVGFSTGALAKGQIAVGIQISRDLELTVIELSALRLRELDHLVSIAATENLNDFKYVSVHAPTDYLPSDETYVAHVLEEIARRHGWPVILHPDSVHNVEHWSSLGSLLYVENMDKRKPTGRTVEELQKVLLSVPEAHVCFDIAHARQVDSSMTEAYRLLRYFAGRIRQIHFSEIGSDSRHRRVSDAAFSSFAEIAPSLPAEVPVILETVIEESSNTLSDAAAEVARVSQFIARSTAIPTTFVL